MLQMLMDKYVIRVARRIAVVSVVLTCAAHLASCHKARQTDIVLPSNYQGLIRIIESSTGDTLACYGKHQIIVSSDGIARIKDFDAFVEWREYHVATVDGEILTYRNLTERNATGRSFWSLGTRSASNEVSAYRFFVGTREELEFFLKSEHKFLPRDQKTKETL